jgi:hypothetical protein
MPYHNKSTRMKSKQFIGVLIAWIALQLLILAAAMILWNFVMPSISVPKVNLLQIILLYALFNLFRFNWIKSFTDNNLDKKIKK